MGLFSDTKNHPFTLISNNPPFEFKDFKETFVSFITSDAGGGYLAGKGFAIEGEIKLDELNDEKFEVSLRSENKLSSYGALNVGIKEKGENQGFAVLIINLEVTLTLKKGDKEVAKEFYNKLTDYYNEKLNPEKKKLMFTTGKSNTLNV